MNHSRPSLKAAAFAVAALAALVSAVPDRAQGDDTPPAPAAARLPHVFLIGDSTVRNGTRGQQGWGTALPAYFDATKVTIDNRARGGRSSRTYLIEGLWDAVLADLQPGDFVLMQFGHNDSGPLFGDRARASLHGTGEETQEGMNPNTHQNEVVHTYGWYLRKYIADAKSKGATAVVFSPVPRNRWDANGKVMRNTDDFGRWAHESAEAGGAAFVDLNEIVAQRYEQLGPDKVKTMFPADWTHTNPEGADINAASVVAGLKGIQHPLSNFLSEKGAQIPAWTPAETAPAPAAPNQDAH